MKDKINGLLIITLSYIVAGITAYFIFDLIIDENLQLGKVIIALLVADVAATIIVWISGLIFRNSSFYDAYWSLMPFLIILCLMIKFGLFGISNIIFLSVLSFWSWRLTFNWIYTFESLKIQDWRYENYKKNNTILVWHLLNFFGINLMPTLIVFLGIIPGIVLVIANSGFNIFTLIGATIICIATIIETMSDVSMHKFRKNNVNKASIIEKGLWKYSRHPNYFGEILVWLGIYLFMLPIQIDKWYLFFGFVAMVCLFVFVSIPLAEKRQLLRRPIYADYQKRVSMLVLLPNKKNK